MRQPYRCVMVLAGSLALGFQMSQLAFATEGDPTRGKSVYQAKCVTCHGPEGKGDGPIGKQLNPPAGDFTGAQSKKKSEAELLDVIQNGKAKTAMMAWKKQLNETEILDVLAYLLTLRK